MRVPRGPVQTRRHQRMRKLTKGMCKTRQSRFVLAKQAMFSSWKNSYRDRKLRKRDFRSLWITRLNAAARANGLNYSQLIASLHENDIALNRKMLSEIAIHSPATFKKILSSIGETLDVDIETKVVTLPQEEKPKVAKRARIKLVTTKTEAK